MEKVVLGYGFAKANELTDAIRKGGEAARKNMIRCPMEGTTIPHEIIVHWDGATILLKPAPAGTGVIAGSKVRAVLRWLELKISWQRIWEQIIQLTKLKQPSRRSINCALARKSSREEGRRIIYDYVR